MEVSGVEVSRYYVLYEEMQTHLSTYYQSYGRKINYPEMTHFLFQKGMVHEHTNIVSYTMPSAFITDKEFLRFASQRKLPIFPPDENSTYDVIESSIIPEPLDVYTVQQMLNISTELHTHDFFEMVYVFQGTCLFTFQRNSRVLRAGEMCVIAPGSEHSIDANAQDSIVFMVMIRKSTFNSTFFSLLSRRDLLSDFFRTILYGNAHANYLLFFTDNSEEIKSLIKQLFMNSAGNDCYANVCSISLVNLLFAMVLRGYSKTIQFYDYQLGTDFSLVLQYIQNNYLHLTLKHLAEIFHYSESYLSVLIKRNTNHTFSELITRLRISDAVDYLLNTNLKVAEIAELCGYNSADHFSRTFRRAHGVYPVAYRAKNRRNS